MVRSAIWRLGFGIAIGLGLAVQVDARVAPPESVTPSTDKFIVWTAYNGRNNEVWIYDINTGTQQRLSDQYIDGRAPAIDSPIIVWEQRPYVGTRVDIYGYDLRTKTTFPISVDTGTNVEPRISRNTVVWTRIAQYDNWDIYGYDLTTGQEFPIEIDPGMQAKPEVSGRYVVWEDARGGYFTMDIYGYDLKTKKTLKICTNSAAQGMPMVDNSTVIWLDNRGGDMDIYGYDLATKQEFWVTKPRYLRSYHFSSPYIVWYDDNEFSPHDPPYDSNIFLYDFRTQNTEQLTTNPYDQDDPKVSGDWVIYLDGRRSGDSGPRDVYAMNLRTRHERSLVNEAIGPADIFVAQP